MLMVRIKERDCSASCAEEIMCRTEYGEGALSTKATKAQRNTGPLENGLQNS